MDVKDFIDGLTDKPNVRRALKLMAVSSCSGAPEDQARTKVAHGAMKGADIGEFNRLRAQVLEFVNNQKEDFEMPKALVENDKQEIIKRTEKALKKAAKKSKAKKPKKEEVKHDFTDKKDRGARVYTPHGVGVIRGFDAATRHYQVEIESTEEKKVVSEGSTNFKAFKEDYRDKYIVDKTVRTPSGAYSISNADKIAKALNGLNPEQCAKVADAAGIADRFDKWSGRNPGMQRMNLGNVLRAMLKRDDSANAEKGLRVGAGMPRKAIEAKAPVKKVKKAPKKTRGAKKKDKEEVQEAA